MDGKEMDLIHLGKWAGFPISKSLLGAYGWLWEILIPLDKAGARGSDMSLRKGQEWADSKPHPPTSTGAAQEPPHRRCLCLTLIHTGSRCLNFYLSLLGQRACGCTYLCMYMFIYVHVCLMCRWGPEVKISVFLSPCLREEDPVP